MLQQLRPRGVLILGIVFIIGSLLLYIAFFGTIAAGLGVVAGYFFPTLVITIGLGLVVGHFIARLQPQKTKTHSIKVSNFPNSTSQVEKSLARPDEEFPQKKELSDERPRSYEPPVDKGEKISHRKKKPRKKKPRKTTLTLFSNQEVFSNDQENNSQITDKIFDELLKSSTWGTDAHQSYLLKLFHLKQEQASFNIKNHSNFHWVTNIQDVDIENPGRGDCLFYSLACGLVHEIVKNGRQDILQLWQRYDPQWNIDQEKLTAILSSALHDKTLQGTYRNFWDSCQLSLRRILVTSIREQIKQASSVDKREELKHSFIFQEYASYLRHPNICPRGNFFTDVEYQRNDKEKSCQRSSSNIALISTLREPKLESVKTILSASRSVLHGLILYQDNYYIYDALKNDLSKLTLKDNEAFSSLFYGCELVNLKHSKNDQKLFEKLKEEEYEEIPLTRFSKIQQQLLQKTFNVINFNGAFYLAIHKKNDTLRIKKLSATEDLTLELRKTLEQGEGTNYPKVEPNSSRLASSNELSVIRQMTKLYFHNIPKDGYLVAGGLAQALIENLTPLKGDTEHIMDIFLERFEPKSNFEYRIK